MRPPVLRSFKDDDEGDFLNPLFFLEVATQEDQRALHVARRFVGCLISGGLARQRHERCRFSSLGFFDDLPAIMGPTDFAMPALRSEEHTSELQSLMRISYAVFCLKKKKQN